MKKVKTINRFLFNLLLMVSIFGITNVKAATKNIEVKEISVKDKSGTITVVDPVLNENEVTSNITFNQVDDFVTFELTLKNNESKKYKVKSVTDNNTNENIKTEYSFNEDFMNTGDTSKVTIKLTYKNKLINVDKVSLNDLRITITLENEAGDSEEVIINPVTGDNIFHYLVLLIVALVGIGLIIAKKKIKGIKVGSLLIVLSLIMIPFAALASEKYEVQVKFTNIEINGEFETYSITIDPKNGTNPVTKQITYGDPIGELPANPSKDGYEFDKWVDGDGNEVTPDTVITGQIEVEAKYNAIEYNITYDLGEGSLPSGKTNPSKYTIESEDFTLNNPELVGYTFIGWTGTGIDTQTTSVTISKGSKDDRSYEAHYSANGNTAYKVIHRFAKLTEGYDEEEVTEYGTTGSTIPAPRQARTGFITPAVQNVTIKGDGSASITYTYERETYEFSISDRTYVDGESTADGEYPYGTSITVKANERAGYDFAWSDGNSNYERTFELTEEKELTPEYTARTDTPYVVKHYKQKVTLDGYEIEDTQNLSGTTDTPISPAVNTYTGFTSPAVQNTTINGSGDTVVEYYYDREMYTLSFNNNENVTSTKSAGTYPYGTQVTLTANTIQGYTFNKWSNDETSNPYTFTLTGTLTIEPEYTANTDTTYSVTHRYRKLTTEEDYDEVVVQGTGTTGETIPAPLRPQTGFVTPQSQNITIAATGDASVTYTYERETYIVTFDTDGGSTVAKQTITYEQNATRPTTNPTKTGYTFDDWYTDDTYQTVFDFTNTSIIEDTTIYAKFDELPICANNENITNLSETTCSANENITVGDGIVCKRAVKLHEETCSQTSGYCYATGYSAGGSKGTSTITYGNCGTSGTLTSGDAFTCDVNGDGKYDELTERFYYVSDYYDTSTKTFDTNTAVLIYYNNVTSGVSCNKNTYAYDSDNTNYNGPRTLISQLPTTSQWSNVSLKNTSRQILAQNGNTSTGVGTLPEFDYSGYAARFITAQELNSACGITIGNYTPGELDSCNFVMENTNYAKPSIGSYGLWLETPPASNSNSVLHVYGYNRSVRYRAAITSGLYGARPAIEVLKSNISY